MRVSIEKVIMSIINQFPFYLKIFILLDLIIIVIGIILVYIYNFSYLLSRKNKRELTIFFNSLLQEMIFDKDKVEKQDLLKIRKARIHRRKIRKIFIKCLTQFSLFLKGEERQKINTIYRALKLHQYVIKDLSSFNKRKVKLAVNELSNFRILVDRKKIVAWQKSNNDGLREVANLYTLKLYSSNLYDFFDYARKPLTQWEQLIYFQEITKRSQLKKPHFKKWIDPKYDNTIIKLALDLVAFYYQENATEAIYPLLTTSDNKLRLQMLTTLGKLNNKTSIGVLMAHYFKEENIDCKREVIKSLGYMSNKNMAVQEFLKKLYESENEIKLKKALIIALQRNKDDSLISSVNYNFMGQLLEEKEIM